MASNMDIVGPSLSGKREKAQPISDLRFDWIMVVVCVWWLSGIFIDGWAHSNIPRLETFFTPWHAVLYSGYLAVAITVIIKIIKNLQQLAVNDNGDGTIPFLVTLLKDSLRGGRFLRAIPVGYELALQGIVIFAISGIGDMIWHIVFGIERGTEALLSPTHLGLALGVGLAFGSPSRAAWSRSTNLSSWRQLGPAILSLTFIFSLLTFFTAYAYPLVDLWPIWPGANSPTRGITSILLQTGLIMSFVLLLIRRWRLPMGTFTFMFALNGALMTVFSPEAVVVTVPTAFLGGLAADLVYWRLQPGEQEPLRVRLFAFLVPAIFYGLYFIDLAITGPIFFHSSIIWSVPFWTGAPVIAGITGSLLSYVMIPPGRITDKEEEPSI
jgi:hypothetical protein